MLIGHSHNPTGCHDNHQLLLWSLSPPHYWNHVIQLDDHVIHYQDYKNKTVYNDLTHDDIIKLEFCIEVIIVKVFMKEYV